MNNGIKVLGVCGVARSGKDTFCAIAKNILAKNGIIAKQYSFADQLKHEVDPYLLEMCGVSAFTLDTKEKTDIRDFLVWYGTTWWRNRDPKRWIRSVDVKLKLDANNVQVALISDVRYPNEADWIRSWGGYLVYISAYDLHSRIPTSSFDDGPGPNELLIKSFFKAPNDEEKINCPLVKNVSDYQLEWENKGLLLEDASNDKELKIKVLKALNSCCLFNDVLTL